MSSISGISSVNPFGSVGSTGSTANTGTATSGSNSGSTGSSTSNSSGTSASSSVGPANLLISQAQFASSGAAGALSGSSTLSVLGASIGDDATSLFGSLPSQNSQILNKITQTAIQRFSDLKQQIDDQAATRTAAIQAQDNQWITVKAGINNANAAVTNGQDAITQVANMLLTIRDSVAEAGTQGQDQKYWASQFDTTITSIDSQSDNGGPSSNLVGNISPIDFSTNQIQYDRDPNGTQSTLNGTFISTAYRIQANDGTVWVGDNSGQTLTHYSEVQGQKQTITTNGITLDDSTSTTNGVKLVSYDPKTNAITMQITINPDDPPRTVTGTLQRTGIGLMPSWFYDNLTTSAGRQRAFSDISAAEVNLSSASATLQAAANQVGADSRAVDAKLSDLTQQSVKVQTDQLQQEQDLQQKSVQQLSALQTNLQSLQNVQQNYLDALAGAVDDPLGQTLLNIQI